jgi:hypothetical protein
MIPDGILTVTGPKGPISPRSLWPCRWPAPQLGRRQRRPRQAEAVHTGLVAFRFQEVLGETANAGPHPGFQRIEPILPKKKRSFGRFLCRFCGIRFHGVISLGAPTPIRFEQSKRRLRHLQISTTPATAPRSWSGCSDWIPIDTVGLRDIVGRSGVVFPLRSNIEAGARIS